MKIDCKIYNTYSGLTKNKYVVTWSTETTLHNHLTQYFTKEMAIEQVIYHYKQLSK